MSETKCLGRLRLRPLSNEELAFREWAAHRMRESMIEHPWYADRDKEEGMEFWRNFQASAVNTHRDAYEAFMTGPDVPVIRRTWRRARYFQRHARRAIRAEYWAWVTLAFELRFPRKLRFPLREWRCYWRCEIKGGRRPTMEWVLRSPFPLVHRQWIADDLRNRAVRPSAIAMPRA